MAKHVLLNPVITLRGVTLSSEVESAELAVGVGNVAVTAFGDTYEQYIPTQLKHWSCRLNFLMDYDSSQSYAITQALLGEAHSTDNPLTVRPVNATQSATNPTFSGNVVPDGDWNVIGGGVGEAHKFSITLKGAGDLSFLTSATA